MQPTEQMMTPVLAAVRFMATDDGGGLMDAFVRDGVVVVENFPPFLFEGGDALGRWRDGFRAHAARNGLSDLACRFGDAQDFAQEGARVFFVLPTTWSGLAHGAPFSESGGWAFVLDEDGGRWRIRSYAWAVTSGPAGA